MLLADLPKSWRGIQIKLLNVESIADLTDKYTLEFKKDNLVNQASFYVPKIENNRFSINGNNYVVYYRLCKPICSIQYINNIHTVTIHNILTRPDRPDNYDISFYIKDDIEYCNYKNHEYLITNTYLHDIFYSYWITNNDREDLNKYIDSDNYDNNITYQDITNIFKILRENPDYIVDWKDLSSMRVINIEDLIICNIMLSLSDVLKDFYKGTIYDNILTKNIRSFLVTDTPEIRLDLENTEIASYAHNKKVILPFDNYCDVNDLIPDKSWYEYLDLLDAPQSIKIGSIASFSQKVIINNKKVEVSNVF